MVFDGLKPYIGEEPYIFISYSHKDSAEAAELIRNLIEAGYRVWYDEGLTPGSEWDEHIAIQIRHCAYLFPLISENFLASRNCLDELKYALDEQKAILLIYLTMAELPGGLKMRAGRYQALFMDKLFTWTSLCSKIASAEGIEACRRSNDSPVVGNDECKNTQDQPGFDPKPAIKEHSEPLKDTRARKRLVPVIAVAFALCAAILAGVIISSQNKQPELNTTGEPAATQNQTIIDRIRSEKAVFSTYGALTDDEGHDYSIGGGTCFLINDDTILTTYNSGDFECLVSRAIYWMQNGKDYGVYSDPSPDTLLKRMSYYVLADEGVSVPALLISSNAEQDYAILKLVTPLEGAGGLKLRKNSNAGLNEKAYAIGVKPGDGPDTLNVHEGIVKGEPGRYSFEQYGIDGIFVKTSCVTEGGDGGGPVIDAKGCVLGLISMGSSDGTYASAIGSIIGELDRLKIPYSCE